MHHGAWCNVVTLTLALPTLLLLFLLLLLLLLVLLVLLFLLLLLLLLSCEKVIQAICKKCLMVSTAKAATTSTTLELAVLPYRKVQTPRTGIGLNFLNL